MQQGTGDCGNSLAFIRIKCDLEFAFFFAAVDGKHAVALQMAERLGKVMVHGVNGVVFVRTGGAKHAGAVQQRTQAAAQGCVV